MRNELPQKDKRIVNIALSLIFIVIMALSSLMPIIIPVPLAFIGGLAMEWSRKRLFFVKPWLYWPMFTFGALIPLILFFLVSAGKLYINFSSITFLINLGLVIVLYPLGILICKYGAWRTNRIRSSSPGNQKIVLISNRRK